jgi:glucose-6-phosphate 1-dehydrogenase
MKPSKKEIESKFPPIINGTYKKDKPNESIGYQKWEVRKTYEVEMLYEIVAKTQKDADELLEKKECIKLEDVDGYGKTFLETITGKHSNDMSGDEVTTWKKVEECVPSEDTDSDNDFKPFLNYEDGDWSKDDYEWLKKEDGTNIKKK